MIVFEIDITDLADAKLQNDQTALSAVPHFVKEVFSARSPGRVVLKRSYCNAPDDIYRVYDSLESFKADWKEFFGENFS